MNPFRKYIDIIKETENTVIDRPPKLGNISGEQDKPGDKPGGFTVCILNDGYTPAEVVVEAIVATTNLSPNEARERMMSAHRGGWAAIKSYASKDVAESVADKMMRHARSNTNYDHYRKHPHFRNFQGPWPLTAEVTEAGGGFY